MSEKNLKKSKKKRWGDKGGDIPTNKPIPGLLLVKLDLAVEIMVLPGHTRQQQLGILAILQLATFLLLCYDHITSQSMYFKNVTDVVTVWL